MNKENRRYVVRIEYLMPAPISVFVSANAIIGSGVWSLRLSNSRPDDSGGSVLDAEFLVPVHLDVGDRFPVKFGHNVFGHCTVIQ